MIGVVLWTDFKLRQAVIWCEDHGDLVYFRWNAEDNKMNVRKGDCVAFSIAREGNLRLAYDLRVIEESQSPELAKQLARAEHEAEAKPPQSQSSATVMSWEDARCDPLYSDPGACSSVETNVTPAIAESSYQVGDGTVVSFPDKHARDERAQSKRRSG
ncbi:hypothetical protein [Phaeobacter sp. C3_T13_0]|uniref:hypothetical protein n=1 Tax=Phaeobacter cretensis TaxID=3342641 RepID=UPI0039BCD888